MDRANTHRTKEEKIRQIYQLSTELYYMVADDNMRHRGHPGVMGPCSSEPWNVNIGTIEGAIRTLRDVSEKLGSS